MKKLLKSSLIVDRPYRIDGVGNHQVSGNSPKRRTDIMNFILPFRLTGSQAHALFLMASIWDVHRFSYNAALKFFRGIAGVCSRWHDLAALFPHGDRPLARRRLRYSCRSTSLLSISEDWTSFGVCPGNSGLCVDPPFTGIATTSSTNEVQQPLVLCID